MNGISLPPLSLPLVGGSGPDSRPSSRCSSSSTVFTSVPRVAYEHHVFQSPSKVGYIRRPQPSKLPSLHNTRAGAVQKRYASTNDVRSRYSAKYRRGSNLGSRLAASSPFLQKSAPEDCLKCMLKVPHKRCEAHKYIRVGGGYRHSYWFVKCLLEELELQRQQELIRKQRLDAIKENKVRAIRTYIRTKSGRLVERIIYLDEEDYEAFKAGKNQKDILAKYLSKDEAKNLASWDKDEVKAIKTYVRTKSGRLIEKLVYVSKDEYQAMKDGKVDAKDLLKKYINTADGETVEGWGEAEMKTIKTYVRTKSGRLIEKTIMVSKEDYDAMMKDGKDPAEILKKYMAIGDGDKVESWQSAEPMKSIKMKIRTKSGRIIEKTIMVSKEDYEALTKGGAAADAILGKYMAEGDNIESWEKADTKPMKVIKTMVRTKSGRLIEKTILLTEEEYKAFQESGGDPEFLKKFIKLGKGEAIEDWEKASTVYEASDDEDEVFKKAKAGAKIIGKDGTVYEVVVDPLTGKKYKKKIGHESDFEGLGSSKKGKGKDKKGGGKTAKDNENAKDRSRRKQGKRNEDSDSEYSYRSVVSAGGTKHVRRRRKKVDGTYSDSESYHSDQDPEGAARRRRRRRERKHGSDSEHSYYSVVSAGGTRKVKRRRKRNDGTYSDSESYHSSDSGMEGGGLHKGKKKKRREHGSDSEYSYHSEVSEGGTKTRTRKKRIRDEHGRVIGHGKAEVYSSPENSDDESVYTLKSDGKGGKVRVKKEKPGKAKGKKGKGQAGSRASSPDVFSDATTDSDAVDLDAMTEEERTRYLSARDKRRAEREKKRREKYGDEYDEMVAKHEKKKQDKKEKAKKLKEEEEKKKAAKSMVSYDKMQGRDKPGGKDDGREPGLGHDEWGKKKKTKDGNEGDDESDDDEVSGNRKKKKGRKGSAASTEYDIEYDDKGNIIKKVRRKKAGEDESEYEDEYDEHGNVIGRKKKPKRRGSESSEGDYFETTADGKIKLKKGKKKIDLTKLTDDDLRKLGIDPNLSKSEIARLLKEKFGDDLVITTGKTKVGTRRMSEYGSDVGTDELADDSDLDVSTLKGQRRVKIKMKRGGQALLDHMKKVMEHSDLQDGDYAKDLDEKGEIDFLSHYRLVDPKKLEGYARAFVVEDEDYDTVINSNETRIALDGVPSIQAMTEKQMDYVLRVLKIDDASQVTFRMFAVITALCERVTQMDPISKHLLEICDLLDIERKMDLYRMMFYTNTNSDRDANFITAESLKIELIAGGLNWNQQQHIMERLRPNVFSEISFLDYLCYIPLFLSMHDNICLDPLDMRDDKYTGNFRMTSGSTRQRDMNPLGYPMKKDSSHVMRQQAKDLLEGRINPEELKKEKLDLLNKYATLPKIIEKAPKVAVTENVSWH